MANLEQIYFRFCMDEWQSHNELCVHEMIRTVNMIGQAMKIIENQLGTGNAARL
jgi:hypothetical protein